MNPLRSMVSEIQGLIRRIEGDFAPLVLPDFEEGFYALPTVSEQVRYCTTWLRMYKNEIAPDCGRQLPNG